MTITTTEISLDEACDRVLARWDRQPENIIFECRYGHFDCSYRSGGPCMNEATSEEFARAREEVPDGQSAGGTKPPAGSERAESMESTR